MTWIAQSLSLLNINSIAGQDDASYLHRVVQHIHVLASWKQLHRHAVKAVLCIHDSDNLPTFDSTITTEISTSEESLSIPGVQVKDLLLVCFCHERDTSGASIFNRGWFNLFQLLVSQFHM